ncbi:Nucleoporin Nup133/Nup155-like C-terminal [Trinorchestia longiramus]|nr:Nucleoporin Nup133/Nup155-like C-terminal [Trinorchestia longiramus]
MRATCCGASRLTSSLTTPPSLRLLLCWPSTGSSGPLLTSRPPHGGVPHLRCCNSELVHFARIRKFAEELDTRPPLVVTQLHQLPRELVVLSAAGAHLITCLRPVDQLRHLLQENRSADSPAVKEFFTALGATQACCVALILATDPNSQCGEVAQIATQCLFRYGATAPPAPLASTALHSSNVTQLNQNYSFHPTQISTPLSLQQHQQPQHQQAGSPYSSSQQAGTADDSASFSALHNALYLHLARVVRPVWTTPMLKPDPVTKLSESSLSSEECCFLARQVEQLARFISSTPDCTVAPPQSSSNTSLWSRCSSTEEARSVAGAVQLLRHLLQLLRLWTLLTEHQLPSIITSLSNAEQQQLQGLTLRDLALSGGSLCRALVMALLDKYHGDEANISAISRQLRSVCPSLYRAEDAQLSAASQLILGARSTSDPTARDAAFAQAVALCKGVGGCVNVAGVAAQLAGGGCYTGLVDLALSVAGQRDNEGRALLFYKTGQPPNDSKGYAAFTSRMECYRVVMEHLAQLASNNSTLDTSSPSAVSVPARPGPPTPATKPSKEASCHAQQMIELLCRSGDELAQVTLFQWLLDTGRTEQLLALPCPSLEGFLKAPPKGSPRHDLLWRFYERNKEYYKAARTLALLADEPGSTSLGDRVEHLSRSLMCLSSCEMNTASAFTDFLLHLEEKKDVARVQLMVLEGVKAAEHIIRLCEVQSVRLKAASVGSVGWLAAALLSCGVTITRLLHTYHARLLREQCLDRLASYLTDLDASAEPSSGLLAAHLRTCQVQLERAFA